MAPWECEAALFLAVFAVGTGWVAVAGKQPVKVPTPSCQVTQCVYDWLHPPIYSSAGKLLVQCSCQIHVSYAHSETVNVAQQTYTWLPFGSVGLIGGVLLLTLYSTTGGRYWQSEFQKV